MKPKSIAIVGAAKTTSSVSFPTCRKSNCTPTRR